MKVNKKITFVTALYDIDRERSGDGRRFEDYLNWIDKTLSVDVNFIVFTESKVVPFIPKKSNIRLIETKIEDIPLFYLKHKIDSILTNETYKSNIQDPQRIECKLSLYNIIQYSKFEWLKKSIVENYFKSDYFFWIDAGCSRFFDGIKNSFPNESKMPEKFLIQGNINTSKIIINDEYKWRSDCVLVGGFFGGPNKFVIEVSEKIIDYLHKEMINKNIINNEQIALALVCSRYPELFKIFIKLHCGHLPLLKELE